MSQDSTAQAPGYIKQLNALRGLAALVVVCYHVHLKFLRQGEGSFLFLFDRGYLAVDLFFILSGFVLMYVYGKHASWAKLNLHSYFSFITKRSARIFPVHWLLLFFYLGVECVKCLPFILKHLKGNDLPFYEGKNIYTFMTNFFLVQNWGLHNGFTWNVPAWSISAEWFVYLMAPVIMIGLNWFKSGWKPLLGWLGFYGLMALFFQMVSPERPAVAYIYGNGRMLFEFLMGGCLCLGFQQLQKRDIKGFDWLALLSALGIIVLQLLGIVDIAFPALLSLLILSVALAKGWVRQLLSHNSLFYLGEISFSLYLVHQVFTALFVKLFHLGTLQADMSYLAACLVASGVTAHFLYNWVEIPVRDKLNGHFNNLLAPLKQSVDNRSEGTPIHSSTVEATLLPS
jgi:peptidoglycan/LPS O-acetylase OafA/YrhL